MNITQNNFFSLLSGIKQYQIPIYQRNYRWTEENCKKLLEDIVRAGTPGNPNHYIGSVIVKGESEAGGVSIYNVIDGQQRTTTITLLLLALRDYWHRNSQVNVSKTTATILDNIKDIYLTNNAFAGTSLFTKILPKSGMDRYEYTNLLHDVIGTGAISNNYSYFLRVLTNGSYDPSIIFEGINNAQIALVSLDSGENPQLLFEAVNDTGVDLTNVDLVRNWLFMGLSGEDQDRLYRQYWEPIENEIPNNINDFLFYFTELKSLSIVPWEYYKDFKKTFILSAGSADDIELLLTEIKAYVELYAKYLNEGFENRKIKSVLNNILKTGKNNFTPLVLKILFQWENNSVSLDDAFFMLQYLEAYIVRRDILSIPTNSLNPAMQSMLKHSNSLEEFKNCILDLPDRQRMPDDVEMQNQLLLKDFYHLSGAYSYLERIEKDLNQAFSLSDPTIEHILPETIHTHSFPKAGVSPEKVDDYDWEIDLGPNAQEIHDRYQHTLGNLTILPRGENARMGDYRFNIKKNWSSLDENGFNYGYMYTPIRISQSLRNYTIWDETAIEERCNEMVNHICRIWPHP